MAKLIKKISVKTVCGKLEPEVIGKENGKDKIGFKARDVMQVVGVVTSTRDGRSTFGDFMGFRGQFQATNCETGEVYRSSQCFLPDDTTDMIAAQLAQDDVKVVEFGFMIGINPRPDLQIGYEYTARPLIEPGENDVLAPLLKKVAGTLEHKPDAKVAAAK